MFNDYICDVLKRSLMLGNGLIYSCLMLTCAADRLLISARLSEWSLIDITARSRFPTFYECSFTVVGIPFFNYTFSRIHFYMILTNVHFTTSIHCIWAGVAQAFIAVFPRSHIESLPIYTDMSGPLAPMAGKAIVYPPEIRVRLLYPKNTFILKTPPPP